MLLSLNSRPLSTAFGYKGWVGRALRIACKWFKLFNELPISWARFPFGCLHANHCLNRLCVISLQRHVLSHSQPCSQHSTPHQCLPDRTQPPARWQGQPAARMQAEGPPEVAAAAPESHSPTIPGTSWLKHNALPSRCGPSDNKN